MTITNFSHRLFTGVAWEAHLEEDLLQGKWKPLEQYLYINMLEMRAFSKALQATGLVSSYNSSMVSYINREGVTRSVSLW